MKRNMIEAVLGAQVIVRPSALLRSADIWELTNRARAYDNHVYVIGANATGAACGWRSRRRFVIECARPGGSAPPAAAVTRDV